MMWPDDQSYKNVSTTCFSLCLPCLKINFEPLIVSFVCANLLESGHVISGG